MTPTWNGGPITAVLNVGPLHAASFTLHADGSFDYTPAANYNGSDSFTYHAFDGSQSSSVVTASITINAVNDAPVLTGFGDTPSFIENGSSVILDTNGNASVSDVELDASPNKYEGATLTIARSGGPNADDSFVATGSLDLVDVSGTGENVSLDGGATFIGTFTDPGDGSVSFTFNANATAADINQVMRQIAYANASDNPPHIGADCLHLERR
jgi:VCBS repeat-containing protein